MKTVEKVKSPVDPESGLFWKNERERMYCYSYNTACDKHGFILGNHVSAGNIHDSKNFEPILNQITDRFDSVEAVSADAGYIAPQIVWMLDKKNIRPVLPYKRPQTKKGYYKKYDYVYDELNDVYLCPNNKELTYTTTTRQGKKQYKSNPWDCKKCDNREQCTQSKNMQKVIERHVWAEHLEEADHLRHTYHNKKIYQQRSQTIERVFADAKVKHGMRETKYRGVGKVTDHALLLFACMNMKKISRWIC